MAKIDDIVRYCDQLLSAASIQDYCPNGLQVAGCSEVQRILTGVTASQDLLDYAVAERFDTVLVHHGYLSHIVRSNILLRS